MLAAAANHLPVVSRDGDLVVRADLGPLELIGLIGLIGLIELIGV